MTYKTKGTCSQKLIFVWKTEKFTMWYLPEDATEI